MIAEALGKIIGLILAHGVIIGSDLNEGELLVPVVIYYEDGVRKIETFEADTQIAAVDLAVNFIGRISNNVDKWAFIQDGLITLDNGTKQDVYFMKAWVKGMSAPLEIYQMYQSQPFKLIENIQVLNFETTGIAMEDADTFSSALDEGIFSHPSATKEQLLQWF